MLDVHVTHLSGFRIRRARHDAELSQAQLAYALEVPVGVVQAWESGREPVDALVLHAVAVVLGCPRESLQSVQRPAPAPVMSREAAGVGHSLFGSPSP
jgi:DNA-binding transcriptional regulator YiaG